MKPRLTSIFIGLGLVLAAGAGALAQQPCPTLNCVQPNVPAANGDASLDAYRRYFGSVQSRRDPRLSSTAIQTDCVKYDLTDPRPAARNCDLLPSKDRRLP